ncbi:MAG: FitA-like ribbon-helix-helix domain-containing protein [Rhodanobacteraceae bacterium]
MANLIVRNLDEAMVRKLKARAVAHSRSAEAEHRSILEAALAPTRRKTLAEVLARMPDVGTDADFVRVRSGKRPPRVFD